MDHYSILGLSRNATKEEIKVAFRNCALKFHPDRHSQSNKEVRDHAVLRFKQVSEAYEVLIDDRRRTDYDRAPPRRPFTGRPGYSSGHRGYGYGGGSYYGGPPPRSRGLDAEMVLRFMTTRGFLLNAAFACALLGGAAIIEQSSEAVWKMNNSGKSFEEAMESIDKIKVQKKRG